MRRPKRYTLQQLFRMFTVFGVDLDSRWQEATTTEQAAEIYEQAKREAKKRYLAICREVHPDRGGDEERMKEITALWSVIDGLKPKYTVKDPAPQRKSWLDIPPTGTPLDLDDSIQSILRQVAQQQIHLRQQQQDAQQRQQQAAFGRQVQAALDQQFYASKVQRVQDIFNEKVRTPTATVVSIHFPGTGSK